MVLDHAGNFLRHGRVTQRIEYSLQDRIKCAQTDSGLRTCPGCFRMVLSGRSSCPECRLVFSTESIGRAMPEQVDGELQMYSTEQLDAASAPPAVIAAAERAKREQEHDAIYWQLVSVARARKLPPRWVSRQFHLRTGIWRSYKPAEQAIIESDLEEASLFQGVA